MHYRIAGSTCIIDEYTNCAACLDNLVDIHLALRGVANIPFIYWYSRFVAECLGGGIVHITLYPVLASFWAIALPIPRVPRVTNAVLFIYPLVNG